MGEFYLLNMLCISGKISLPPPSTHVLWISRNRERGGREERRVKWVVEAVLPDEVGQKCAMYAYHPFFICLFYTRFAIGSH